MTRIKQITGIFTALVLCSCKQVPEGVVEVNVKGWNVPAIVLVTEAHSFECSQLRKISEIILMRKENIIEDQESNSGYYFLDYEDTSTSFRAYFRPQLLISEDNSIFVFCSEKGKPYQNSTCSIKAIEETYCYSFSVEGRLKNVETFDAAISAVNSSVHEKWN